MGGGRVEPSEPKEGSELEQRPPKEQRALIENPDELAAFHRFIDEQLGQQAPTERDPDEGSGPEDDSATIVREDSLHSSDCTEGDNLDEGSTTVVETEMPFPYFKEKLLSHCTETSFNPWGWILKTFVVLNKSDIIVDVFVTASPVLELLSELNINIGKTESGLKVAYEHLKVAGKTSWEALEPGKRTKHTLRGGHVTILSQANASLGYCVNRWVEAGRKLIISGTAHPVQKMLTEPPGSPACQSIAQEGGTP